MPDGDLRAVIPPPPPQLLRGTPGDGGPPPGRPPRIARRTGLNLEPGSDDDGWESPPPTTLPDGSVARLYKDGEALAAAYDAAKRAKRRLLVESYIVANDETGEAFCDLLAEKAAAGVGVYLIYDSLGSLLTSRNWFDRIADAGGNVAEFHPVNPLRCRHAWRPGLRDHRKLLVVDDVYAGIGGMNIGTRYAGRWVAKLARFNPDELWRDAAIGLTGPAVRSYARCFARTWRYTQIGGPVRRTFFASGLILPRPSKGRRIGKDREHVPDDPGPPSALLHDGGHGLLGLAPSFQSVIRPALARMIRGSRQRVWLTMAYFAPDDGLIGHLCDAAERGVDVRLMLAARSDVHLLVIAARSFYDRLTAARACAFGSARARSCTKSRASSTTT